MRRLYGLFFSWILLSLFALYPIEGFAQPITVITARAAEHGDVTRFVMEITGSVAFTIAPTTNPNEVLVDLPELNWQADAHTLGHGVGLLQHFGYALTKPGAGQLSLGTRQAASVQKAFIIPPAAGNGYRLVIDLVAAPPPAATAAKTPAAGSAPAPSTTSPSTPGTSTMVMITATPAATTVTTRSIPTPKGGVAHEGKPVVVIDPGHGGVDPGATSITGAYEKNIVLALAHEVKAELDKDGKVTCILTRDRDVFIPLRERVAIARSANADLFMSLHADTVTDPDIRGLSVYTLSQTSSDTEAQALADKENKADIVAGIDLSNESPEVTNILIDLVQRESMNHSAVFAHQVIDEVSHETRQLLQNTHRFAGFAVLKAPDIPSILVETGYLSNEHDEQMLRHPEYRAKLATALARAIEQYFAHPRKGHHA